MQTIVDGSVRPVFLGLTWQVPSSKQTEYLVMVMTIERERALLLCQHSIPSPLLDLEISKDAKRYDTPQTEFHQSTLK